MATILAPTQKLQRLRPGREWRASRATPCEGEAVAIFAWGRELLPRRPPGYTGGRSNQQTPQHKARLLEKPGQLLGNYCRFFADMATSILFLALRGTSNSPVFAYFLAEKRKKNAKNTNVRL